MGCLALSDISLGKKKLI